MHRTHAAFQAHPGGTSTIGDADLLPRQPIFRTRDLEHAREYLGGVFGRGSVCLFVAGTRYLETGLVPRGSITILAAV